MKVACHILRFFKDTRHFCLTYRGAKEFYLLGFSGTNLGGDKSNHTTIPDKISTGYIPSMENPAGLFMFEFTNTLLQRFSGRGQSTSMQIIKKLSPLSYQLELQTGSKIDNVVSIILLLRYYGKGENTKPLPVIIEGKKE